MTRPVSFLRRATILLELYRENWQGGNIYVNLDILCTVFSLLLNLIQVGFELQMFLVFLSLTSNSKS